MSNAATLADRLGDARSERHRLVEQLGELSSAPVGPHSAAMVEGLSNLIAAKTAEIERLEAEQAAAGWPAGQEEKLPKPMKIPHRNR